MFERRNQSILAPHYTALVHHDTDTPDAETDDVFTLARRNHDLDNTTPDADAAYTEPVATVPLTTSEDLSKRKLKLAATRKGQLKLRPTATKMLFGEDGESREVYEAGVEAERAAAADRGKYVEDERERMSVAHKEDREVAREKKRERKRKRKEREREVDGAGAVIGDGASGSEDGFERKEVEQAKPMKKGKLQKRASGLEDDEALALRLLLQG